MAPALSWYPLALTQQIAQGKRTVADIARRAAASGIGAVELYDGLFAPVGPFTPEAVRQVLGASGLAVSLLVCAPDFGSPFLAVRRQERAAAEGYLVTAEALGAPAVRFAAGQTHPGIRREDALEIAAQNLKELAERAAERGLAVCVENQIRDTRWQEADISAPFDAFAALLGRLEDTPVRVLLNTGNPPLVGTDVLSVLARIGPDSLHGLHLSDRREGGGAYLPLGDGPTPWPALKAALRARDFGGTVGIVDGHAADEDAQRSLAFARAWLSDW